MEAWLKTSCEVAWGRARTEAGPLGTDLSHALRPQSSPFSKSSSSGTRFDGAKEYLEAAAAEGGFAYDPSLPFEGAESGDDSGISIRTDGHGMSSSGSSSSSSSGGSGNGSGSGGGVERSSRPPSHNGNAADWLASRASDLRSSPLPLPSVSPSALLSLSSLRGLLWGLLASTFRLPLTLASYVLSLTSSLSLSLARLSYRGLRFGLATFTRATFRSCRYALHHGRRGSVAFAGAMSSVAASLWSIGPSGAVRGAIAGSIGGVGVLIVDFPAAAASAVCSTLANVASGSVAVAMAALPRQRTMAAMLREGAGSSIGGNEWVVRQRLLTAGWEASKVS